MSFYKNLINGKYNTYEKVASVNEDAVKSALNELSSVQLNALAEELDVFTKEASEINLESSLFEEDEYISYEIGKEAGEEETVEEETVEEETVEEEPVEEEPVETEEEVAVEEEIESEASEEEEETIEEEAAEVEDEVAVEEEIESEASEEDFEIVKEACEQVGDYLAENNLTISDYVYSLTGLEKHASHIGEMAEKVAMVYDIPVVMAARDLVSTMISFADEE